MYTALLLALALGATNPDPTWLGLRGTATESGTATASYELDGCTCEASVPIAVDDTAAEICDAMQADLDEDCEPEDATTLPELKAQRAILQAQSNAVARQLRNIDARIEAITSGRVYTRFVCEPFISGSIILTKAGGVPAPLDPESVSIPAGITVYLPGE